jgi:hypothetical protein
MRFAGFSHFQWLIAIENAISSGDPTLNFGAGVFDGGSRGVLAKGIAAFPLYRSPGQKRDRPGPIHPQFQI